MAPDFTDFIELVALSEASMSGMVEVFRSHLARALEAQLSQVLLSLRVAASIIVVLNVAMFIVARMVFANAGQAIDAVRLLLRLLPPQDVARSPKLLELITGVATSDRMRLVSAFEAVVRQIDTAFASLSPQYTVEAVNNSFLRIFQRGAGEVIGQQLASVIPRPPDLSGELSPEGSRRRKGNVRRAARDTRDMVVSYAVGDVDDGSNLYGSLDRLVAAPSSEPVRLHVSVSGMNLAAQVVPVLGDKGRLESLALLLSDVAPKHEQEDYLRAQKARLDAIRAGLLPPHLAGAIMGADGRFVRFRCDDAVVVVVELGGFDTSGVAPKRIAEVLDAMATEADTLADGLVHIRRVRHEGSTITGVAGLFDRADVPAKWASEAAQWADRCRAARVEVAQRFGVDFTVRVGIAYGPAMGGIITDSPSFVLAGSAMRVAEDLARRAAAGTVVVDENVEALVAGPDWHLIDVARVDQGGVSLLVSARRNSK